MMWILLRVHITLHGMIGGLLKHFPKAVCGIIFICKNISECQKRKLFFISVSMHPSYSCTPRVQFKLRERDIFLFLFFPFFPVSRWLRELPVLVSSTNLKMQSAWNHRLLRPLSPAHTKIRQLFFLNLGFLLQTLSRTNLSEPSCLLSEGRERRAADKLQICQQV